MSTLQQEMFQQKKEMVIEISPENVIIELLDGTEQQFKTKDDLVKQLALCRANDISFETHYIKNNKLYIIFQLASLDYQIIVQKIQKIWEEKQKPLIENKRKTLEHHMEIGKKSLSNSIEELNILKDCNVVPYTIFDKITSLMASFTGFTEYQEDGLEEYSFLTNLYWSDFGLLGKLTYVEQNISNLYYHHFALIYLLKPIVEEITQVAKLRSLICDLQNRRKNKKFSSFETEELMKHPEVADEIIEKMQLASNEPKRSKNQGLQKFLQQKGLFINFTHTEKLCKIIKCRHALIKVQSIIENLKKIKPPFQLIEKEAILNQLSLLGEYVTNKRILKEIKDKKPHIDWQKYIDLRDFIEHQIEKGCTEVIKSCELSKIICDFNPLETAIREILEESSEKFFLDYLSKEKKCSTEKPIKNVEKKKMSELLSNIDPKAIKEFSENNMPLRENDFKEVLIKRDLLLQYDKLLKEIIELISDESIVQSKNEIAKLLDKSDAGNNKIFELNDILKEKLKNSDKNFVDNFLKEFQRDLNNIQHETLRKILEKNPDKKVMKKFSGKLFLNLELFNNLFKKISEGIDLLKNIEFNQQYFKKNIYSLWAYQSDLSDREMEKLGDIFTKLGHWQLFEEIMSNKNSRDIGKFKKMLEEIIKSQIDKKEKEFALDSMKIICQEKPIHKFLRELKIRAHDFQKSFIIITNHEKINYALGFIRRIDVLLHNKLHDEAFQKRIFSELVAARKKGFREAWHKLSKKEHLILKSMRMKANNKLPDEVDEETQSIIIRQYIDSGLYEKFESALKSKEISKTREINKEFYSLYKEKIDQALKEDPDFSYALQYNMKQAIHLLHDISQDPNFNITMILSKNYKNFIKHRNYLAHDDDYVSQILNRSNHSIITLGKLTSVLDAELNILLERSKLKMEKLIPFATQNYFIHSIATGNYETVHGLININNSLILCTDWNEISPLMHAVKGGFENIVKLLLQFKVPVNHQNAFGDTALHIASRDLCCLIGNKAYYKDEKNFKKQEQSLNQIIVMLIENNADMDILNAQNESPAYFLNQLHLYNFFQDINVSTTARSLQIISGYMGSSLKKQAPISVSSLESFQYAEKEQSKKIKTLADGNCAFNAVAIGLGKLVEVNKLQEHACKILKEKFNNPDFSKWLQSLSDSELQNRLSPVLREMAVEYIESKYGFYKSTYQELLLEAFENFREGVSEDTFIVHPHIEEKFNELVLLKNKKEAEELHKIFNDTLMKWWEDEGKNTYFKNLKAPALGADDNRRWGSEVEINAVAYLLGITIKSIKGDHCQLLGVGHGIISNHNISDSEINQLVARGIGSKYPTGFRIEVDAEKLKKILETSELTNEELENVLKNKDDLLKAIRDNSIPNNLRNICFKLINLGAFKKLKYLLHKNEELEKVFNENPLLLQEAKLEKFGLSEIRLKIGKYLEENNDTDLKISSNSSDIGVLCRKLLEIGVISKPLTFVSEATLRLLTKMSDALREKISKSFGHNPCFIIKHAGNHWSYEGLDISKDAALITPMFQSKSFQNKEKVENKENKNKKKS